MKANELRIGNLVCINLDGDIITSKIRVQTLMSILLNESQCEPIQLTEKWLEKLGFWYNDGVYCKDPLYCFVYPDEYLFEIGLGGMKVKVDYVHQLQNIYFSVTGEELIVKE